MVSNDELFTFSAALGTACFQAQSLENSLVSLFAVKLVSDQGCWVPKVRDLMDTRYGQTLGRLVKDAAKELNLPPHVAVLLEEALKRRNWVVHHFYREYGAAGLSSQLTHEATMRLQDNWRLLENAAEQVHELSIERQVSAGKSKEQVLQGIESALQRYLSKDERDA